MDLNVTSSTAIRGRAQAVGLFVVISTARPSYSHCFIREWKGGVLNNLLPDGLFYFACTDQQNENPAEKMHTKERE
jgi:hypothetical protein